MCVQEPCVYLLSAASVVIRNTYTGVAPEVHLERAKKRDRLSARHLPELSMVQDWKLIGILTDPGPDSRPQHSGTSPTLGWSVIAVKLSGRGGDGRVALQLDL